MPRYLQWPGLEAVEHRLHTRLVVHLRILLAAGVARLADTVEEVGRHSLAGLVVGTVLVLEEPIVRKSQSCICESAMYEIRERTYPCGWPYCGCW